MPSLLGSQFWRSIVKPPSVTCEKISKIHQNLWFPVSWHSTNGEKWSYRAGAKLIHAKVQEIRAADDRYSIRAHSRDKELLEDGWYGGFRKVWQVETLLGSASQLVLMWFKLYYDPYILFVIGLTCYDMVIVIWIPTTWDAARVVPLGDRPTPMCTMGHQCSSPGLLVSWDTKLTFVFLLGWFLKVRYSFGLIGAVIGAVINLQSCSLECFFN